MITSNNTCLIMNGSSIVAQEINRYYAWISPMSEPTRTANAVIYLTPGGMIDTFRTDMEQAITRNRGCTNVRYVVGSRGMDASGIGNIVFGFHIGYYNLPGAHTVGTVDQFFNPESIGQRGDNPDDYLQIEVGQALGTALANGQGISASLVESYASTYGLQ